MRKRVAWSCGLLVLLGATGYLLDALDVLYVPYVGASASLGFWSLLTALGLPLGAWVMSVGESHGRRFRGAPLLLLGFPLLGYFRGRLAEGGMLLLLALVIGPMIARRRTGTRSEPSAP